MINNYKINTFLQQGENFSEIKIDKNFKKIINYKKINDVNIKQKYIEIIKIIFEKENVKVDKVETFKGDGKIEIKFNNIK